MPTVKELKLALLELGLSTTGLKHVLEIRLREAKESLALNTRSLSVADLNSPGRLQMSDNIQNSVVLSAFRRARPPATSKPESPNHSIHDLVSLRLPGLAYMVLDGTFGIRPLGAGGCAEVVLVRTLGRAVYAAKRAADFPPNAQEHLG
jgi:hypothetical protein